MSRLLSVDCVTRSAPGERGLLCSQQLTTADAQLHAGQRQLLSRTAQRCVATLFHDSMETNRIVSLFAMTVVK